MDDGDLQVARERAERDLAEQHHRSQEWLDAIPVPMFFKDTDLNYRGCNAAFERYTGLSRSDLMGKSVHDLLAPDVARVHDDADRLALSSSDPVMHESIVRGHDGSPRSVVIQAATVRDSDGTITGMVGVIFDITDLRHAEATIVRNEELYRRVLQDQIELLCRTLPGGTLTFVNAAYARFFGRSPDELVGTSVYSLIPDDDGRAKVAEAFSQLTPQEPVVTVELPFAFSDGRSGWLQWTHRGIFDEGGRLIETQATGIDTTTRKRAEQHVDDLLREREATLNSVADGIVAVDIQGNHRYVNPAAAKMLGYTPEELVGRGCHATWHHTRWDGSPYPPEDCPIEAPQRDGQIHTGGNEPFSRKDGTRFAGEFVSSPLMEGDRVAGVVVAFRDTTPRRLAEDAQQLAVVGQLAAGVAHDLGNLFSGITMWGNLTKTGAATCDQMLVGVLDAAGEGASLAKNLVRFARPHSEPLVEVMPIEGVLDIALGVAGQRLQVGKVTVVKEYANNGKPVSVDRTHVGRVFVNLIINAGQAMPNGGTLTLGTSYPEGTGEVVVTVADTGEGISADTLPRIFEPFFTTKQEGRGGEETGTGLGLSVAQDIVAAHGGSISVQSEEGVGTTFEVRLPTAPGTTDVIAGADDAGG